jgi:hypothetical protein
MTRTQSTLSFAVLTVFLTGAGCSYEQTVKPPRAGQTDMLPAHAYPQIAAQDSLDKAVRFGEPVVEPAANGKPMRVTVPARSLDDRHALNVQYRFEFLDDSGRPLTGGTDWRYQSMPSRVQVFFDGVALGGGAADWRLIVRSAQ